jgi:S1-C subfamily serine protease
VGIREHGHGGVVSGLDRSIPTGGRTPALVGLIQTDAPISPGNSGSPLANGNGQVIGINVAFIPPQARAVSIGFAIPSTVARDVVSELLSEGSVEHAFLGVQLGAVTPEVAERFGLSTDEGGLVLDVVRESPAGRAGLRPGDLIVEVAGQPARVVEDVLAALRRRDPGDRLALVVARGDDRREVTVRLAELPTG